MSNTRRAAAGAPLAQNRYASSPLYDDLRGVNGVALAPRAAVLRDPAMQSLLWALAHWSHGEGGLDAVAAELAAMFPERLGTGSMHKFGMRPGQWYNEEQVRIVREELACGDESALFRLKRDFALAGEFDACEPLPGDSLDAWQVAENKKLAEAAKKKPRRYTAAAFVEVCHKLAGGLGPILLKRSIDPTARFLVHWFKDLPGALLEYKARREESARDAFALTSIGRKVWEALDLALETRRMVLVDGLEGRGKTEATRAWCECHPGEARFVSLKGTRGKLAVFKKIADALGIGNSQRSACEIEDRIGQVLKQSGIMLVIDEAHFAFDPRPRMYSRPELIDWIDTALCNEGIPVALVTTPQFLACVKQAADQVAWNYRQFRRRLVHYEKLQEWSTDADLSAVARHHFPDVTAAGIKLAVGYAKLSKLDVSAIGDLSALALRNAAKAGHESPSFEDLNAAVTHLAGSAADFKEAMEGTKGRRPRQTRAVPAPPPPDTRAPIVEEQEAPEEREELPSRMAHRGRPSPALLPA